MQLPRRFFKTELMSGRCAAKTCKNTICGTVLDSAVPTRSIQVETKKKLVSEDLGVPENPTPLNRRIPLFPSITRVKREGTYLHDVFESKA